MNQARMSGTNGWPGWKSVIHVLLVFFLLLEYTDAAWSYYNKPIMEGPVTARQGQAAKITSDNKTTVYYDITGDYTDEFKIDHGSGRIYQVSPLDREKKSEYLITAIAVDAEQFPSETPISFKLIVLDINDNYPVFNKSTLIASIEESHSKGADSQPFMRVEATDADEGYNGEVVYSVQANSDTPPSLGNRFTINPITGDVRIEKTLHYETNQVVIFNVIASDGGGQPNRITRKTISQVIVNVQDVNNHAPKFVPLQDKALSEASQVGIPLYHIYATDEDAGMNKKVYFAITDGNKDGTFDIISHPSDNGTSVGDLILRKDLDYESGVTTFALSIMAFNKDASNADDHDYQATETLKITVTDANEPPIFRNTPYSAIITEGPAPSERVPIMSVFAEDLDFDGNQTVTYFLKDAILGFGIDFNTGVVYVSDAVDREEESVINGVYHLQVLAIDNYDNGEHGRASATIKVVINDVNDNPPMPERGSDIWLTVCDRPKNATVTVIKATDVDSAENGSKFYFAFDDSVDTSLWRFEPVDDQRQRVVAGFSNYGLKSSPERVQLGFNITDSGINPQIGTATLTITICRCDEHGEPRCSEPVLNKALSNILAIAVIIILICLLTIAVAASKRRSYGVYVVTKRFVARDEEKLSRQSLHMYEDEICEKDNNAYDLLHPCNAKDYFTDANMERASDSVFIHAKEGLGSDAGSLPSVNSNTADESMSLDNLQDWGKKFKGLATTYNNETEL